MKKLLLSTGAFLSAIIILSSCGSTGVSLTKRHYRNGYNLEVSSAKTNTESKHAAVAVTPAKEVETIVAETLTEVASTNASDENSIIKHKPFSFNSNESASVNSSISENESKSIVSATKGSKIKNVVKKMVAVKKTADLKPIINKAESDNNLGGLIWTLVGILLVVWLVSLLTGGWGLGNFLHVFLVVALVLILLRLIHVI